MTLLVLPEVAELLDKVMPYLNEKHELPEDAPEEIKAALKEARRLSREQEEAFLAL